VQRMCLNVGSVRIIHENLGIWELVFEYIG
jgi:hypothetical protein